MRLIVIGALLVGALAVALLLQVTGHTDPTPARSASVGEATSVTASSVAPTSSPEVHARTMPSTHAMPALAPTTTATAPAPAIEGGKPKHIDTPTDVLRWSLMHAVQHSEPAVIDCIDNAKSAGTVVDGRAVFAFFVTEKNGHAVISRPSLDSSSFPEALNTCVQATLASGELDQQLPEGQNEFRVQRELVVEKGTITMYKLKSFLVP